MIERRRRAWWLAFATAAALFWGLRAVYWATTEEAPFSDMADFRQIAEHVANGGTLAHDEFWQSYRAPLLPLLGALQIRLTGHGLLGWRIGQALLLFGGLCWLAREVWHATGARWLALALLVVVAISRPSVFWSLKFAKEGLHEALLDWLLAMALRLCRRPSWWLASATGALAMAATLNRSNTLAALPILAVMPLFLGLPWPRRGALAACVVTGIALAWTPWGLRTNALYGRPLALTTDGAAVMLDGLHDITVPQPDGTALRLRYDEHMQQAQHRFANDAEADAWLAIQVRRWVLADPLRWLRIWRDFAASSAFGREITLTAVPRGHQLPPAFDWLLLDKHRFSTSLGLAGLALAALLRRRLALLALLVVPPWLLACAFLGLPRLFEPIAPLVSFGSILPVAICLAWRRSATLRRCATSPPSVS